MCIGTLAISLLDYDIVTSLSTSASMLGNIGPGLGTLGPFTDYSAVPVAGKWIFSGLMLLGRLELLSVIILFTRSFYKR
jgi:trk system potassium uptake protein TrkH